MFIHQSRGSFRLIALVVLSVFSSSSLGVAYETEYSAPDANHNSGYMTKSMPSDMYAQSSANVESRVDTMNEVAEMNEMAEINSMDTPPPPPTGNSTPTTPPAASVTTPQTPATAGSSSSSSESSSIASTPTIPETPTVVPVAPTTSQTPTSPAAPTSPTISQSPNIPATTTPAPGSLLDRTIPDTTTEPAYDWVMLPPNTADPSITLIRLSYSSGRKILEKKSTTQVNHSSQIQTFSETTVKLTETRFVWDSTIEPLGGWKESICDVVTTRTIKLETIYKELNPGFFITDVGGDLLENSTIVEQKFFRSVNGNPLNMLFSNQSEIESMRYKDGRPRREINTMSVWRMNAHTLSYGHQKNYRYDGNSKLISKDETSFNGNINATFTKTDPDHDGVFTASHLKVIRDNQLLYDGPTEQCPLDVWVQLTGVLA